MEISNLSFKFNKNSFYFFKDLTVKFEPNQVHFIQGDNGVGKSTLFNILQGTTSEESELSASVTLDGQVYCAHNNIFDMQLIKQIHTVQQNYDRMIANQFSFFENLQLANLPTYPGLRSLPKAIIFDVAKKISLDMVSIPAYRLSGGQRQLLAILMSLQKQTRVLLLDEPTATLDKKNAHIIIQCLQKLAVELKVTMLIICHDKELVDMYANGKYFVMEQVENGTRNIKIV